MTRWIAISEEAYKRLSKLKDNKKSFTKVILELTEKESKDISDLFGSWKMSDQHTDNLKNDIKKSRKRLFNKRSAGA